MEADGRRAYKTSVQFRVRYAPHALLSDVFDMEMVYMFPSCVVFMFDHTTTIPVHRSERPRGLTLAVVLLAGVALATSAAAEQFYVPLGSGVAGISAVTEVKIVNRSDDSTTVAIELLDPFGSVGKTTQINLAAGETTQSSEGGSEAFGAMAIKTNGHLFVNAVGRSTSSGAISSVPVLEVQDAMDEGMIPIGTRPDDAMWKRGVGVVNPDAAGALLIVSLHRGEHVIDEASLYVPAGGARVASMADLFSVPAGESGDWLSFRASQSLLLFGYDANPRTGAQFFRPATPSQTVPSRRRAARRPSPPLPTTQTVVLTPSKDNTLYETSNGSLSNGSGVHLFAGATNQRQLRRALLRFDLTSQIPPGSRITSASLAARVSQTISGPQSMELRRVSADWGEGSSNAGASSDGDGAPSQPGDATWLHSFFPNRLWSRRGGDFAAVADATAIAGSGNMAWASSTAMIARVQEWLDQSSTNFGWIIVGNEALSATAKRFDSREIVPSPTRPSLTIEFTN